MGNIRRYDAPSSAIFITQVVEGRKPAFREPQTLTLLRETLTRVKALHPFTMRGYVFLPDHLHLLIVPTSPNTPSSIMHSLKTNFTKNYKKQISISGNLHFWQRRFYDHIIRNDEDFLRHIDYIHYNPVRHKLVTHPEDWSYSSFAQWRALGRYPEQWGWTEPDPLRQGDWRPAE